MQSLRLQISRVEKTEQGIVQSTEMTNIFLLIDNLHFHIQAKLS